MAGEKYGSGFVRRLENRNGKPWQGVLKYSVPNPDYVEPPAQGEDTRTANQRKTVVFKQRTKVFDPAEVRTKTQATRALEAWRGEMERSARSAGLPGPNTPVGAYVSAFVDDLEASGNVERVTISGYRTTTSKIAQAFPNVKLADLTRTMIQKWENGLTRSGLAPATVIKYHRLLSEVCEHAVSGDDLVKNPCKGVKLPKRDAPSPNSLTADGYKRLDYTLSMMEPSPVVIAATIALHTGMRQGEICGLRWRCYDEERHTITVEEAIGKAKGGTYAKTPKTKQSKREVPVSAQLAQALERRRVAMVQELEMAGITLNDAEFGALYVIGYTDGRYHSPSLIGRGWKALSGAFGLSGTQGRAITFHDLRHSWATRAIAAGADVKAVSAVLGHANAAITLNVYADADPESKRRAVDLITQALTTGEGVEAYSTPALVENAED